MQRALLGLYIFGWLLSSSFAFASEGPTSLVTMNYRVDARLSYIDRLTMPRIFASDVEKDRADLETYGLANSTYDGRRTLGLRMIRLETDLFAESTAYLHLVFRPDALVNRGGLVSPGLQRDFDSRAWTSYCAPYCTAPTINLLDAYQIVGVLGELRFSAGVYEALQREVSAYPSLLEFGLRVKMPQKFAGVSMDWLKKNSKELTPGELAATNQATLTVFQGNEDRGETFGTTSKTFDNAPIGQDPYYGIAVSYGVSPLATAEASATFGLGDTMVEAGRRSDLFGQLTGSVLLSKVPFPTKVSIDSRYMKRSWRVKDMPIKDLSQLSVGVTSSHLMAKEWWMLLGMNMGRGEWHRGFDPAQSLRVQNLTGTQPFWGYQLEAGVMHQLSGGIDMSLLAAQERRDTTTASGKTVGAFGSSEENGEAVIRRFIFELGIKL